MRCIWAKHPPLPQWNVSKATTEYDLGKILLSDVPSKLFLKYASKCTAEKYILLILFVSINLLGVYETS